MAWGCGTGPVGPVACGQVLAPPGPTHSHTAGGFPEQKSLSHNQKDPTPQLGKPKPTPGLVVGCHGDRETHPLLSTLRLRERRPLVWLGGGTVPPGKPLLPKAALRLGHLDQRLPPLSDSCAVYQGFLCPLPRGLLTRNESGYHRMLSEPCLALAVWPCLVTQYFFLQTKMLLPNLYCCVKDQSQVR